MRDAANETVLLVAEAAADALDRPVDEIPPLTTAVDLDALDTLLSHSEVRVSFQYAGLNLLVHSDDTVFARPIGDGRDHPQI